MELGQIDITKLVVELEFEQYDGTVVFFDDFDAEEDAEALREAMRGAGTDEEVIIVIATKRTREQRQMIFIKYKQMYGRDLIEDFRSELSGNFLYLIVALFTPLARYDAKCLRDAMKGLGTDEKVLIEILTSRTDLEIKAINKAYRKMYKRELEEDLADDTSGDFRRLLIALNTGSRDESPGVNFSRAEKDAAALFAAGEARCGTNEGVFIRIFCSRSFAQLRATFRKYREIAGKDIIDTIKDEFSGDIEDGLISIVQNARCPPLFFARILFQALKGLGTAETAISRILSTRCEVDLLQIGIVFESVFEVTLKNWIREDTSGNYKKLLMSLLE